MFVLLYMSYMCERARASPRAGIWGSGARRVSAIRRVWFRAYLVIPDDLGCGGSGGPKCPLFAVAVQEDQVSVSQFAASRFQAMEPLLPRVVTLCCGFAA